LAIFTAAFGSYVGLVDQGWSAEAARVFSLIILGFSNLFLVYVNQSETGTALTGIFRLKDRVIWCVNIGIIAALTLITYVPAGNAIAKTAPLNAGQVLTAIALAAASTFWWELVKMLKRTGANASDKEVKSNL
jgi:Ca2+-transporting ATPase